MRLEHFQMIDEVITLDIEGASIVARTRVPRQSPVFSGHFPGYPLMPGVLLAETMAQASGYLILALNDFSRMPLLATINETKIRSIVRPGSDLEIEAWLEHDGSGFAVTGGRIRYDGERTCDARLTFRTVPFPTATLEEHMRASAERLGLLALEV